MRLFVYNNEFTSRRPRRDLYAKTRPLPTRHPFSHLFQIESTIAVDHMLVTAPIEMSTTRVHGQQRLPLHVHPTIPVDTIDLSNNSYIIPSSANCFPIDTRGTTFTGQQQTHAHHFESTEPHDQVQRWIENPRTTDSNPHCCSSRSQFGINKITTINDVGPNSMTLDDSIQEMSSC